MFAIHLIVLLTAFICHASAKTSIQNQTLTYECTKDGKIIINGTDSNVYGSIFAVETLTNGSHHMCTVEKHVNSSWVKFTVGGCNVSQPVIITVMTSIQSTNENMVLGGKHVTMYALKCNEVRLGGLDVNMTLNIEETDGLNISQIYQKEVNLTMDILNKDNKTLKSNLTVVIGEELHLIISGNSGFTFLARSCIATDGTTNQAHSKPLTLNGTTLDASVISNFSYIKDYHDQDHKEIGASLFAFHFMNTNNVSIICNITVCQDDDNSCPFNIQNNSGRRKRSSLIQPHTQTLEASLRVIDSRTMFVDKTDDSNTSGASIGPRSLIVPLILCASFGFARIQP